MNIETKIRELEKRIEELEWITGPAPGMIRLGKCEVCGERGNINYILDGDNPPEDSLFFCIKHEPFFLSSVPIDWIGRIKKIVFG